METANFTVIYTPLPWHRRIKSIVVDFFWDCDRIPTVRTPPGLKKETFECVLSVVNMRRRVDAMKLIAFMHFNLAVDQHDDRMVLFCRKKGVTTKKKVVASFDPEGPNLKCHSLVAYASETFPPVKYTQGPEGNVPCIRICETGLSQVAY